MILRSRFAVAQGVCIGGGLPDRQYSREGVLWGWPKSEVVRDLMLDIRGCLRKSVRRTSSTLRRISTPC